MAALFIGAIFLAATLLFLVQPMAAKAILPLLGGSPAVWNTSMVFFQGALLAGYAYSHGLARRLSLRAQVMLHAVVLAAAGLTLPAILPSDWAPPADASPIPWVLGILGVMVGATFLVVSTSGPLLQGWFSQTSHRAAKDPYFLYAASNAGSFVGLLAFPLLFERVFDLRQQAWTWAIAYGALGVLILACGLYALRRRSAEAEVPQAWQADAPAPSRGLRLRWVACAFVPSSLLLGVTQHLSTDVASLPLLWVVPLSIYLLTFVLAFGKWGPRLGPIWSWATPVCAVLLTMSFFSGPISPIVFAVALHLGGQFVLTMLCHQRLADSRPHPSRLTEFYLLLALGGVLGGAFNAVVAPVVFDSVLEYPIAVVLACLLRPARGPLRRVYRWAPLVALPTVVFLFGREIDYRISGDEVTWATALFAVILPCLSCLLLIHRPRLFATALTVLIASELIASSRATDVLVRERTFFGVLEASRYEENGRPVHQLRHGTTKHGTQVVDEAGRGVPTSYYGRLGPVGDIFQSPAGTRPGARIGVVGLGAGTVAAYARPGDHYTFFEIDPGVVEIAEDPEVFTYLADARARGATVDIVLGDGRLTLADQPDGAFDLLLIDAFSSDAIPMHLLTTEAVELMVSKVAPGGLLSIHISNRHLDLAPVVGAIASDLGLVSLQREDGGASEEADPTARFGSDWTVLARSEVDLATFLEQGEWESLGPVDPDALWTDQRSDILRVLR